VQKASVGIFDTAKRISPVKFRRQLKNMRNNYLAQNVLKPLRSSRMLYGRGKPLSNAQNRHNTFHTEIKNMNLSKSLRGIAAAATLVAAGAAQAAAITTDTWYFFGFGDTGTPLTGSTADTYQSGPIVGVGSPEGSWTIHLNRAAQLFWTDLQISGDRFEFFANAVSVGTSGTDCVGCSSTGTDIAAALADANYGKGSATLGAGDYTLTGTFLGDVKFGDGAFIVRDLPAPGSLALAALGLSLLGFARRRA